MATASKQIVPLLAGLTTCLLLIVLFKDHALHGADLAAIGVGAAASALMLPGPPAHLDLRVDAVPLTNASKEGVAGFHVFDNLYLHEGVFTALVADTHDVPPWREILRPKQDKVITEWRTMKKKDADELGNAIGIIPGVTVIFNDPPGKSGYLAYHNNFISEAFAGAMKVLGAAPPIPGVSPVPQRFIFPQCGDAEGWRDDRDLNSWLLSTAFPAAAIEQRATLEARASSSMTMMFERVVIVDRWSAHAVPGETARWGKMNAAVARLKTPIDFFEPARKGMLGGIGVHPKKIDKPVVIYMNNQDAGRRLNSQDHDALVMALKSLTDIAEVHVSSLGDMKERERIALMSRATIILGTHNDRTYNQMWMKASPESTVIELLDVGGFMPDQYLLATLLGHRYVAMHRDHIYDESEIRKNGRVETPDFHGSNIRVDGRAVVEVIRDALVNPPAKGDRRS